MNPDFERIKKTTDIVGVVEGYGVALRKVGADHVGLCPFHEDSKPSLRVTQGRGLFHCLACGAAGNAIQFVARREGISDREAALKLCAAIPGVMRGGDLGSAVVASEPVVVPDAGLFAAAVEHYHEALFGRDRRGLDYLKSRGLGDVETLRQFKVGFVTGSLKRKLSPAQGGRLGALFNEAGNERFYLRVVVPILDAEGVAVGLYGRSIQAEAEVRHLYLAGEHRAVWNGAAAGAYPEELIVTEAILDGLAVFAAGRRNVIAAYGAGGWTPRHEALVERHGVRKLIFAYDNDARGETASLETASSLDPKGIKCHRIKWPEGIKDACDYFQYHQETGFRGTGESFAGLLAAAPRIGFARLENGGVVSPQLTLAERTEETAMFRNGAVSYRVKGLGNNGLRVVVTARKENGGDAAHVDNLDLYGARARKGFAAAAGERLGVEAPKVEADLLALLEALEGLQRETVASRAGPAQPAMSEAERAEALALLGAPDLLDRIAADIELAGYVGEPRNKKLAYIIGTSRRLPKPLSAIFRAQSGSGKSFLMETVAELMPPEDVHYFSRLTPQALYYLEPDALTHKLLIVDERDGSEESEYPIRTLQTRRVLKLAVPIKDPNSGKIKTTVLEIHGPIAYMESTTDQQINPENANRCFELYLDETEAQTRAIFAAQRRARSLDGWRHERSKAAMLAVHHNAQRLLRPLKVIIPFVELIEFPAAWLRSRRDNDRFLSLIEGVAFLHQHQRETGEEDGAGFIIASLEDYAIGYDLAHLVFAQAGNDAPKPVADFLGKVESVIEAEAARQKSRVEDVWFTRRMIREAVKLPDHLIKAHMRQIEELEYVQVQRAPQGGSYRYRLLPQKKAPAVIEGLLEPSALAEKYRASGSEWEKWVKSGNRPKTPLNPS
jgi:DNA primase catalytic core